MLLTVAGAPNQRSRMSSLFRKKVARRPLFKPTALSSNFEKLRDVIWTEQPTQDWRIPLEYRDGLIVFLKAGFADDILQLAEGTLEMASCAAVTCCFLSDDSYQKEMGGPGMAQNTISVYRLFLTNVWDVFGSRVRDAKATSLLIDSMLWPLTGGVGEPDKEFLAYLSIDWTKTGPGDRAWLCSRQLLKTLGTAADLDVMTSYMNLSGQLMDHKAATTSVVTTWNLPDIEN